MNEVQVLTHRRSVQQTGSRTDQWWSLRKHGILASAGWPATARLHFVPRCHQRCEHWEGWELRNSFHILSMQEERIPFYPLFTNWYRSPAEPHSQSAASWRFGRHSYFNDYSFVAGGSGANLLISIYKLHMVDLSLGFLANGLLVYMFLYCKMQLSGWIFSISILPRFYEMVIWELYATRCKLLTHTTELNSFAWAVPAVKEKQTNIHIQQNSVIW